MILEVFSYLNDFMKIPIIGEIIAELAYCKLLGYASLQKNFNQL